MQPAPAPPPVSKYEQGLSDNPKKGTNTPITWRQINTFWSQDLDKRVSGSNAVLKVMKNGELVPMKLKDSTKNAHQLTIKRLVTDCSKQDLYVNAIPILRQSDRVMAYFRETERKTSLDIERDRTVQDAAEGAVAGKDDDDEEISSRGGTVSRAANVVRARDKSSELKNVKTSYANKLASIVATWFGWKLFAESLGTDVLESYQGTFQPGSFKLLAAKQANKEVQGNRTNNPWEAIPSWELFNRFLPKVKEVFKATSTNYLACLLQVHLFGLRDNLGGVEIRETDGTIFDSNIGDPSRKDWFNKRTGRLYISHFKTENTAMGQPYDFQLPPMLRDAINVTLAPGAPEANREYLVNIGVGKPTRKGKAGLPLPVSDKIKRSFRAAGLIYKAPKQGRLVDYAPGILEIRHSQVMFKYREWRKKDRTLTEEQISQKIAGFFNHSYDISRGYKHLTFDSLTDPLAIKQGISSGASMLSGAWQMDIEACGPLYHEGPDMRDLVFFSQTFGDNTNGDGVIGHLPKSYRAGEDFNYGLRLTTRPAARDNIGYPVHTPLDNLSSVHIAVRNAATLAPIAAGCANGPRVSNSTEWIRHSMRQLLRSGGS